MIFHVETPIEQMATDLSKRCITSTRIDDTQDIIKKRITNFNDSTLPAFDFYRTYGKVRTIDGNADFKV